MKNIILILLVTSAVSLFAQDKIDAFTYVEIDGPIEIELIQSDHNQIEILKESELVSWEINGQALVVMTSYRRGHTIPKARIYIKDLKQLHVSGQVILTSTGTFEARRMAIQLNGQSMINITIDVEELDVRMSQKSILTLAGAADDFSVKADQQSVLQAKELQCALIDIDADHQSVISIQQDGVKISRTIKNQSVVH